MRLLILLGLPFAKTLVDLRPQPEINKFRAFENVLLAHFHHLDAVLSTPPDDQLPADLVPVMTDLQTVANGILERALEVHRPAG